MKPIINLQDYFVSKWQENLPNDDAEKYLSWYMFKLKTYMVPNAKSVILYNKNTYSFKETRKANDEAWKTIEAMTTYKAKDKEFEEIRYAAFLNLSFLYIENVTIYWYQEDKKEVNENMKYKDRNRIERFYKIYNFIIKMDNYYENKYPKIFKKLINPYYENTTEYNLTDEILRDLLYKKGEKLCLNIEDNKYFKLHFKAKNNLKKMYKVEDKKGKRAIDFDFRSSKDKRLKQICKIEGEINE